MAGPNYDEVYGDTELGMMSAPGRRFQTVVAFAAATAVTLKAPTSIVNATDTADEIAFSCDGGVTYAIEWFAAGESKAYRPTHIGGTGNGTGGNITRVNVWGA